MKCLQEAQKKHEFPPRFQIRCIRNDISAQLQYNFQIDKKENDMSKILAQFQLLQAAKRKIITV